MNCQVRHCVAVRFGRHTCCHKHPRFVSRTHLVLCQPLSVVACSRSQVSADAGTRLSVLQTAETERSNCQVTVDSSRLLLEVPQTSLFVLLVRATCRWSRYGALLEWHCDWRNGIAIGGMVLRLVEWYCDCWNGTRIAGMALRLLE
jgi:hypothetical protein